MKTACKSETPKILITVKLTNETDTLLITDQQSLLFPAYYKNFTNTNT